MVFSGRVTSACTDEGAQIRPAAPLLPSLLARDDARSWSPGRRAVIPDQEREPEASCPVVQLQAVARGTGTVRRGALAKPLSCLAAAALGRDADGEVWWSTKLAQF